MFQDFHKKAENIVKVHLAVSHFALYLSPLKLKVKFQLKRNPVSVLYKAPSNTDQW